MTTGQLYCAFQQQLICLVSQTPKRQTSINQSQSLVRKTLPNLRPGQGPVYNLDSLNHGS